MKHRALVRHSVLISAGLMASTASHADLLADLDTAVSESTTHLAARYRYEHVDQDGFDEDAGASTLRVRLTWESGAVAAVSAGVEADYVSVIGAERYNSTANHRTGLPVVADPDGFDLNQGYLRYRRGPVVATGGRQRILQADQRFVGGVGWRQNEQTYDALRVELSPVEGLEIDYAYVANVNRIFGPEDGIQPADWHGDSSLLSASFAVSEALTVSAFAYLLDFDNDNGPANSNATFGLAAAGKVAALSWTARLARQRDPGDSRADYQADYALVTAELALAAATITAGYELLGSDDRMAAFATPLATLHKFQGWADKFLTTPSAGVRDAYLGLGRRFGNLALAVTYHDFDSDAGGDAYGSEVDAAITYTPRPKASVQLKLAAYNADGFATDTTKVWLTLTYGL